ncbi:MAG: hypothetical protein ACXVCO_06180 [Ktedonobacterales bacterium]
MDQNNAPLRPLNTAEHLFAGGSEPGARVQAIDWSQIPLGPVDT